jgi:hypothetical protein
MKRDFCAKKTRSHSYHCIVFWLLAFFVILLHYDRRKIKGDVMRDLNDISKEELLDLLAAAMDGIDGIEAEQGSEELAQYWNIGKLNRARVLLDQVGNDAAKASVSG